MFTMCGRYDDAKWIQWMQDATVNYDTSTQRMHHNLGDLGFRLVTDGEAILSIHQADEVQKHYMVMQTAIFWPKSK